VFLLLALLLLPGPKETLAGKFPGHAPEYLERYPAAPVPLPDPLPGHVDSLCCLVEGGHGTAEVYAALGDALLARGEGALAYRAFQKAQPMGDALWGRKMQERKDRCPFVDPRLIAEEEREAAVWVGWLKEYERDLMRRGEDPRDLKPFYAQYGRAEDDLKEIAQARRTTWALAVAAGLVGTAAILGFVLILGRRRRA